MPSIIWRCAGGQVLQLREDLIHARHGLTANLHVVRADLPDTGLQLYGASQYWGQSKGEKQGATSVTTHGGAPVQWSEKA